MVIATYEHPVFLAGDIKPADRRATQFLTHTHKYISTDSHVGFDQPVLKAAVK